MVKMFGNLLKAAANGFALLLLIVMPSSFVLLYCSADPVKFEACPKSLWRIDFNDSFKQGEANLVFDIPYQDRGGGIYEVTLQCDGLSLINSTGHQYLRVRKDAKNIVQFGIRVLSSRDADLTEEYGKDTNHSCVFELGQVTTAPTRRKRTHIECQFIVRTLLTRILPNCNLERSKGLIEKIEVLKDIGQVLLEFKSSPNDVVTSDSSCKTGNIFGHNSTQELEDEMFGLNLPGLFTSTIVLEFDPACDDYNVTVREHYTRQRMEDCYYELFALCQEGMLSIKYEAVEFEDDVMYCQPPKSKFTLAMEQLELKFRIESKPVVLLIIILITNTALYVALIPFLMAKCFQLLHRNYRQLEERLGKIYRRYKHPDGGKGKKGGTASGAQLEPIYEEIPEQWSITALPSLAIESNRSSELGMEYDDVETILLGKLSARDLAGVVDIEPEGEEEFTPLQFETEADIEPVKEQPLYVNIQTEEQPLYVNIQADKKSSPSSKVKKRKHNKPESTHHHSHHHSHHSKPESTHHHSHHHSHHSRHKKHSRTEEGGQHSRLTHQMRVAPPDRPLPPPPSFPPPPPPPPHASPQRAPPNAPSLIDFDTPPQD